MAATADRTLIARWIFVPAVAGMTGRSVAQLEAMVERGELVRPLDNGSSVADPYWTIDDTIRSAQAPLSGERSSWIEWAAVDSAPCAAFPLGTTQSKPNEGPPTFRPSHGAHMAASYDIALVADALRGAAAAAEPEEIAHLAVTSKIEHHVRDRMAWWLATELE